MPAADIAAQYSSNTSGIFVKIQNSPIIFDEGVEAPSGRTGLNGFWFAGEIDALTPLFFKADKDLRESNSSLIGTTGSSVASQGAYFYPWNSSFAFNVTSDGVSTTNQLVLINSLTVNFQNAVLGLQAKYISDAVGNKIGGKDATIHVNRTSVSSSGLTGITDIASYGNVITSNTLHEKYTATLNVNGSGNAIGAIMPDRLRATNANINSLKIVGKSNGVLALGTAFGNYSISVSNLTVNEFGGSDRFGYLLHCLYQGSVSISSSTVNAPSKNVLSYDANVSYSSSQTTINNSIGNSCSISGGKMRAMGNILTASSPISITGGAKVVVDGNVMPAYHHWSGTYTASNATSGNLLIVKGLVCDIGSSSVNGGTVIANSLVWGFSGKISNATVIANQITNSPCRFWSYNSSTETFGTGYGNSYSSAVSANDDTYPYLTYSANATVIDSYNFNSGSNVYLLGYYGIYNGATAMAAGNPIGEIIAGMVDENGDYVSGATPNTARALEIINSGAYASNECITIGNSLYSTSTRNRSVVFAGGNIYAGGNITLFNDTTLSGAHVTCKGRFGTKGDLAITGGSVTATEFGNAYTLTSKLEDETTRWKTTTITAGRVTA